MTRMCWATMPNRRWWRRIFFTCAEGASWIAANSTGKSWKSSIPHEFVPSLLKQLYLEAEYLPKMIHVPMRF